MAADPDKPDSPFEDAENVRRYVENGPALFVPGYRNMQDMAGQLIWEKGGDAASVLVVGAGGGLELERFASRYTAWSFTAVDPAAAMLVAAKEKMAHLCAADRVSWVDGYVDDAPAGPFDGATMLLTLHFVPDDGAKHATLEQIRRRLKPGAALAVVDFCLDLSAPSADPMITRYGQYALNAGALEDDVVETKQRLRTVLNCVGEAREREIFSEAGFDHTELFYAGFNWRGWVLYAR